MPDLNEILSSVVKEGVEVDDVMSQLNSYITSETESKLSNLAKTKDNILLEKREIRDKFDAYKSKYGWADEIEDFTQEKYNDTLSQIETLQLSQTQNTEDIQQKLEERYNAGKTATAATYEAKLNALKMENDSNAKGKDTYKSKYEDYLVQNKLKTSLDRTGVKADEYWFEGFKNQATANFNENGLVDISVKHNGSDIPLEDWEKIFPTTDRGKSMIPAGFNTGGGAQGGTADKKSPTTLDDIAEITDPTKMRAALKQYYAKQ